MLPDCLAPTPPHAPLSPSILGRRLTALECEVARQRLHQYFSALDIISGSARDALIENVLYETECEFFHSAPSYLEESFSSLALTNAKRAIFNWIRLTQSENDQNASKPLTVGDRLTLLLLPETEASWSTYFLSGTPLPSLRKSRPSSSCLQSVPHRQPANMSSLPIDLGVIDRLHSSCQRGFFRSTFSSWLLWLGIGLVLTSTFFLMR